jgi:hypothetical protein
MPPLNPGRRRILMICKPGDLPVWLSLTFRERRNARRIGFVKSLALLGLGFFYWEMKNRGRKEWTIRQG